MHWFLINVATLRVLDPTAGQFEMPPPYEKGRRIWFLTGDRPSQRAQTLLQRVESALEILQGNSPSGNGLWARRMGAGTDAAKKRS